MNQVICTYSAVVELDISRLKGQRLCPAMLWRRTRTVNQMPEFRTALHAEGPGIHGQMHPAYTPLNREKKCFTCAWTEHQDNYRAFCATMKRTWRGIPAQRNSLPNRGRPENSFDVSMVPWRRFTAFNINVYDQGRFRLPIFTMGKYEDRAGTRILPLAIQVHHAVCDGYHVGGFVALLQEDMDSF